MLGVAVSPGNRAGLVVCMRAASNIEQNLQHVCASSRENCAISNADIAQSRSQVQRPVVAGGSPHSSREASPSTQATAVWRQYNYAEAHAAARLETPGYRRVE